MKKVFSIAIVFAMIAALFAGIPTTAADPFVEYDLVDEEDRDTIIQDSPWSGGATGNGLFYWTWDGGWSTDANYGIVSKDTNPDDVLFGNKAIFVDHSVCTNNTGKTGDIYTNVFFAVRGINTSGTHTFFFWLKQPASAAPLTNSNFKISIDAYNANLVDAGQWGTDRAVIFDQRPLDTGYIWTGIDATTPADISSGDWVLCKVTFNIPESINGLPANGLRLEIKVNDEPTTLNGYFIDGAGLVVGNRIPANFYERTAPAVEDVVISSGFDAGYGSVSGSDATRVISAEFGDYSGETITLRMSEDVGASFDLTDGTNTITFTQNPGTNDYVYTVAADDFAVIGSKVFTGTVQDAYTNETAISLTFRATPTTYAVPFNVVDNAATPAAVQGATIAIDGVVIGGKATDASGNVTIRLPDGTYTYTISKAGYDDATGTITVNGADLTVTNAVMKIRYNVTFTVKDVAGNPVAGAVVTIGSRTSAPTDANGVTMIDLSTGTHNYTVSKSGYGNVTGTVTVGTTATAVAVTVYADADGDGTSNLTDPDIDGDGVNNKNDSDIDGDGIRNIFDKDIDGDGIPNAQDPTPLGNLA